VGGDAALEVRELPGVEGQDTAVEEAPVLDAPPQLGLPVALLSHLLPHREQARVGAGQVLVADLRVGTRAAQRRRAPQCGAEQPLRVIQEQQLHQIATHRHPGHVRAVDGQGVQHRHGVTGEIADRVGPLVEGVGGAAGVAVVVADDAVVPGQPAHESVGPAESTGAGSHDQQQRRQVLLADRLGPQPVAVPGLGKGLHVSPFGSSRGAATR
jgi:hypothetical protein